MGKGKLVAGIILIVIGVGMIPASIGLDNLIEQRMDESISLSFLRIRQAYLPSAEAYALTESIPDTMQELKEKALPDMPSFANGTITVQEMKAVIDDLTTSIGKDEALNLFFNDPSWTIITSSNYDIEGVSENNG